MISRVFISLTGIACSIAMIGSASHAVADGGASTQPSAEVEDEWRRILAQSLGDTRFFDRPLVDCIDFFREVKQISITVDWASLEALGISKETPVTFRARNKPFSEMLRGTLDAATGSTGAKLEWRFEEKSLVIFSVAPKTDPPAALPHRD